MTTEQKVIGGIAVFSLVLVVGAAFLMTGKPKTSIPQSEIVSQNGFHWHPTLTVTINGKKQPFKEGIGISGRVHNPIHTHDDADQDIVHMEFEGIVTKDDTKLVKFFQIWGKPFNAKQIFDKQNGTNGTVTMLVNGKENKDFENYIMKDKDKIEIMYK